MALSPLSSDPVRNFETCTNESCPEGVILAITKRHLIHPRGNLSGCLTQGLCFKESACIDYGRLLAGKRIILKFIWTTMTITFDAWLGLLCCLLWKRLIVRARTRSYIYHCFFNILDIFMVRPKASDDDHPKNDLNAAGHEWLRAKTKQIRKKIGNFFCVVKKQEKKKTEEQRSAFQKQTLYQARLERKSSSYY